MLVTNQTIKYQAAPYGLIAVIPKGTPVIPASNLPGRPTRFWAEPWEGMSESAESWFRNYGFLIERDQVEVMVAEPS